MLLSEARGKRPHPQNGNVRGDACGRARAGGGAGERLGARLEAGLDAEGQPAVVDAGRGGPALAGAPAHALWGRPAALRGAPRSPGGAARRPAPPRRLPVAPGSAV